MLWIAKDFMAEGITLIGGRPKGGKSVLSLQLGIAVATGTPFLGMYETVKGAVLYVNVDDPSRSRLQTNLRLLGGGVEGLSFMSELPELDNGGMEILDQELARMALTDPCRLLILDTMTALRGQQAGKNLIKSDYDFITSIKRLVSKHGCSVLLISHTRKDSTSSEKVDSIDAHLGTTGITAAVDAVMLLTGADDTKKVLKAKGRDISPFEVHLELQVEDRSGWVAVDAPVESDKKKELSALRKKILDAVRAIGPCGPDAIHKQVGGVASTIRSSLKRMVGDGQLCRNANSLYTLPLLQQCNTATDATDACCTVALLQASAAVAAIPETEEPAVAATPAPTATDATDATESADVLQPCSIAPLRAPTHVAPIEETDVAATPAADATVVEPTAEELKEAAASMDMGWPEKVILLIQQTQDLEAIAAAVRVPVSHVENVMWMDPRVNSRTQNGRRFYFIEEVE